ncbi:unnamed protein product [Spodoptera exigua]|nr:unnamed protein product [Spodoptera exigua]
MGDRIGRRIIKAYRENPSNESLEYGRDVTFKEFALFLTNRSEEMADVHQIMSTAVQTQTYEHHVQCMTNRTSHNALLKRKRGLSLCFIRPEMWVKCIRYRNLGLEQEKEQEDKCAFGSPDGKYETLLEDSTLALHTINASHIQFPRLDHTSGTAEKLHRYFSQLDLPLIRKLYKLYKHDYRIFNYNLDNIVGFDLG